MKNTKLDKEYDVIRINGSLLPNFSATKWERY